MTADSKMKYNFYFKLITIRFPVVLAGAGVYILYLNIFSRQITINEPTIYRLLFASWLFYIFVGSDVISKKKAFWVRVLAAFSVIFVYLQDILYLAAIKKGVF
jgi:hypothetical protein